MLETVRWILKNGHENRHVYCHTGNKLYIQRYFVEQLSYESTDKLINSMY